MLEINSHIQIADNELDERFVRASGPGGQNVNKVSTAVELRFDARASSALPETVRTRLLARRDRRITADGVIVIQANRFRTQDRNREDARDRLADLIRAATIVPKARIATKPSRASKERRLDAKKTRGSIKRVRSTRVDHDA